MAARVAAIASVTMAGCQRAPEPTEDGPWRPADVYAPASHQCAGVAEDAALAALNLLRLRLGAREFACLGPLSGLAADHARYLELNPPELPVASLHQETPGAQGFTGTDLAARAAHVGLDTRAAWLSENVGGPTDPAADFATALATVYHRAPLAAPNGRYAGFADFGGGPVLTTLAPVGGADLAAVLVPAPGEAAAPTAFSNAREVPDPLPDVAFPGFPISIHLVRNVPKSGEGEDQISVDEFTLASFDGGEPVAARIFTNASDSRVAPGTAILVPLAPLESAREYFAHAALHRAPGVPGATGGGGREGVEFRWRFRTIPSL